MEYVGFFPRLNKIHDPITATDICGFNACMENIDSNSILCCGQDLPQILRIPILHRAAVVKSKVLEVPSDDVFLVNDKNSYLNELADFISLTPSYKPRKSKN
eukprot:NODE_56_length_25944_cov_0.235287.p18 type:complete len:102 gc:universal NODE_56_length_25944_cov_0.235287:5379-5684(+)